MDRGQQDTREAARERQSYVRHELRAPLAVMYPLISLLAEELAGPLTDDQRQHLDVLRRSAERLEARIAGATESGWLDCAAVPAMAEAVPLDGLVGEHLRVRSLRSREGPLVDTSDLLSPSPVALSDREQLRTAFATVLHLACAATSADGTVRVATSLSADGRSVILVVEDEGDGMPPEEVARARAFGHTAEAADSAVGLDIELWVVNELVVRNGGTVDVDSREGQGTKVTLTLPAVQGAD